MRKVRKIISFNGKSFFDQLTSQDFITKKVVKVIKNIDEPYSNQ